MSSADRRAGGSASLRVAIKLAPRIRRPRPAEWRGLVAMAIGGCRGPHRRIDPSRPAAYHAGYRVHPRGRI